MRANWQHFEGVWAEMIVFFVRSALLGVLLWQAGTPVVESPVASPGHLRYQRGVALPATLGTESGQACVVVDAEIFAHAAPSLKDLRLFRGEVEIPYAVTLSESLQQDSEDARILNLGTRSGRIVFDLEMPHRPYTNVMLDLAAKDFIATAIVSGQNSANANDAKKTTSLGSFTLFDLTSQRLSHSTGITLPESRFPYLHLELEITAAPGVILDAKALRDPSIVKSASVPPSREAQTVYTAIAKTESLVQRGRRNVAAFHVPVRVPVERISFSVSPDFKGNFSREIEVKATAAARLKSDVAADSDSADDESLPHQETLGGTISRVHTTEAGRELAEEQLSIPAAVGSNMQHPAAIEVAIDNGDDQPLSISAVRLEMRQRRICFDFAAAAGAPLTMYYGDPDLDAPVYDYAKLFQPVAVPIVATLGVQVPNPGFSPRAESRPFTERHPELLWIGLLGVVCVLAITAIRSAKKLH